MEFRVLGPVEVIVSGRRIELGGSRQRTILAALLVHAGEVLRTDRLIDILWGMHAPAGARSTLHSYVSRLRKRLAKSGMLLATRPDGYVLQLPPNQLDACRFEDLVAQARSAASDDTAATLELLDEALALWRGPAYADVVDEDFARAAATRLEELRRTAVEDRIDALFALGRHRETIGDLEAAAAHDPLRERIHAQLVLALYRSGRQSDALAALHEFKERLAEELGIDASPPIQQLERDILRHAPSVQPILIEPAERFGEPRNAPLLDAPRTSFVGRERAIDALARLLWDHRLVTLTGPGGVGKTRLAQETATRIADRYPDGARWCSLARVRDAHAANDAIAAGVGVRQLGGGGVEDSLLATLASQQLLLVVDNCEHLLSAIAPLLDRIIRRCEGVRVLATSRERLCVHGERVWDVPPLEVPEPLSDRDAFATNPSVRLFCDRAVAVDESFTLSAGNSYAVSELCRRLDGVPLAIELAAARVAALPPAELASRLDRRFSLLTAGPRVEGRRHRTLRAVVDWSYRLLSEDEALLFDRLSVFAGDFGLEAAETVCPGSRIDAGDIAGLLAGLVDKSMVVVDQVGGVTRYRLLETLREYGAARLAERGESDDVRRAHADYYTTLAETIAPGIAGRDEARCVQAVEREYDNLRAAVSLALEAGNADAALRIPVALYNFAFFRLRDEVFTWARRAVEPPSATEHALFAIGCASAAQGLVNRGELHPAHLYLERALESASDDDVLARLHIFDVLGVIALYQGRLEDCLAISAEVLEVANTVKDHYFAAWARIREVLAHAYRGDVRSALERVGAQRAQPEVMDNPSMQAWTSYVHGEALLDVNPKDAERLLEDAIGSATAIDNRFAEGVALVSLASLKGRHGESLPALESFRKVIAHWRRLGNWSQQWTTLRNLIELLARLQLDEAAAVLVGAVGAAETARPVFGTEAKRLAAAKATVEQRLGAKRASTAVERGRHMTAAETIEFALGQIDHALQTRLQRQARDRAG